MARTGRPTAELVLSDEEAQTLQRWARRPTSAQALALRAKIVLACAEGATNKDVAAEFSVSAQMVGKWRAPFVGRPPAGGSGGDPPGRPRPTTKPPAGRGGRPPRGRVPPVPARTRPRG